VAIRRNSSLRNDQDYREIEEPPRKRPVGLIFWLAFFIIILGLFLVNQDRIRQTLDDTQILTRLSISPADLKKLKYLNEEIPQPEDTPKSSAVSAAPEITIPKPVSPVRETAVQTQTKPAAEIPAVSSAKPVEQPGEQPAASSPVNQAAVPAARPAATPATNSRQNTNERERSIYFTQVDSAGTILRTKVTRSIPASDSPLVDSLQALLGGPNAEEQRRGMMSLIPKGVKILSAAVRGSTAYISFSEEFQYNTYGAEGYAAQLRQIVWTATEFPTVKDVQILIEGRPIAYLGEVIRIDRPLSRDTLPNY
jgi:spore germination protein GerM